MEMARRAERIVRQVAAGRPHLAGAKLAWAALSTASARRLLRDYAPRIGLNPAFTIHDREGLRDLLNLVRHELALPIRASAFPASTPASRSTRRWSHAGAAG